MCLTVQRANLSHTHERPHKSGNPPRQVAPEALRKAIDDFLEEVSSFAQELDTDVIKRAEDVKSEMDKVVAACS